MNILNYLNHINALRDTIKTTQQELFNAKAELAEKLCPYVRDEVITIHGEQYKVVGVAPTCFPDRSIEVLYAYVAVRFADADTDSTLHPSYAHIAMTEDMVTLSWFYTRTQHEEIMLP